MIVDKYTSFVDSKQNSYSKATKDTAFKQLSSVPVIGIQNVLNLSAIKLSMQSRNASSFTPGT